MPELPEVETYRRYFEASSLNQPIAEFTCEDPRKLLLNDYDDMRQILRGGQFTGTYRVQLSEGDVAWIATDADVYKWC